MCCIIIATVINFIMIKIFIKILIIIMMRISTYSWIQTPLLVFQ